MKPYLIAEATLALVAILAIPHRSDPGAVTDPAPVSSESNLFTDALNHRNSSHAEEQKFHITPLQAKVSVVVLAFGH